MTNDEIAEIAKAANQLAQFATAQATATGVLMDATLEALVENGNLNRDEVHSILQESYTYVSDTGPESIKDQAVYDLVRQIFQIIAEKRGVALIEPT